MPRKRQIAPSITPAERDLNAAIDRIQGRLPKNKKLIKTLKETSEIALTKFNVALEAGRSRTTLDRYPDVLARIETLARPASNSSKDASENLRKMKKEAELLSRHLATTAAAILNRMIDLEDRLKKAPRAAEHVKNNPDPNKAAGKLLPSNVTPLRPDDGK